MIAFLKKLFCRGKASSNTRGCTIYVGNLAYSITKSQLEAEFSQFGNIQASRIIRDHQTGRSKGFGFVTFTEAMHAADALKQDGQDLRGRALRVSIANEKA